MKEAESSGCRHVEARDIPATQDYQSLISTFNSNNLIVQRCFVPQHDEGRLFHKMKEAESSECRHVEVRDIPAT
jgi:hypothetical protein